MTQSSRGRKRVKMARTEKCVARRQTGAWGRTILGLAVLGSLLLTGCLTEDPRMSRGGQHYDPLRGGAPVAPAGRESPPPGPLPPSPSAPHGPATSSLTGTSTTSPAALASGSFSPLDPSRSLQIGDVRPATAPPAGGGGEWKGQGDAAPAPRPERPDPAVTPVTARGALASLGGSAAHVTTFEQAQALLAARGVTWQSLQTWGDEGEWQFSCRIPKPQNPHIARRYEARARDPIAAVRAVLEEIDRGDQ